MIKIKNYYLIKNNLHDFSKLYKIIYINNLHITSCSFMDLHDWY